MKRSWRLLVCCALVICISLPGGVAAQQGSSLGHGKGEPADVTTEQQARAFVDEFVARFNNGDVGVVDMVSEALWPEYFGSETRAGAEAVVRNHRVYPMTLHDARDVRTHQDGHVSVEVSYSGYYTSATYYTERWYLVAVDGEGFRLDDGAGRVPRVLDGMTNATLSVVVSNEGLTLSEDALPAADLLLVHIQNTEDDAYLTTGLYVLPDGVSSVQAQAELVAGNTQFLRFLGPTGVRPGTEWTYGFLIEPGTTYLVQQYRLDQNGQHPQAMAGDSYVATLTMSDAPSATVGLYPAVGS